MLFVSNCPLATMKIALFLAFFEFCDSFIEKPRFLLEFLSSSSVSRVATGNVTHHEEERGPAEVTVIGEGSLATMKINHRIGKEEL